jgi:hypothetical protein
MDFFGKPGIEITDFFRSLRKREYLEHLSIGSNHAQGRIHNNHARSGWRRRHSVSPFQMMQLDFALSERFGGSQLDYFDALSR